MSQEIRPSRQTQRQFRQLSPGALTALAAWVNVRGNTMARQKTGRRFRRFRRDSSTD
jgi:hypothetical protein